MCINESKNIDKGLSFALSRVEGAYGIVIINTKNPELMYAARRGSPLAFGKINDDFIIASDPKPIIEYTKKINVRLIFTVRSLFDMKHTGQRFEGRVSQKVKLSLDFHFPLFLHETYGTQFCN